MKTVICCFLILVAYIVCIESTDNKTDVQVSNGSLAYRNLTKPKRYKRYIILARPREGTEEECSASSDDFPQFFTDDIIKKGGVVLCILIGIYCFTFLALVCDGYFLPCVETICEVLHLQPNVAAATFMSVATSAPELFTNIIGTFITESDLGIGTIVGSSMFNALGVASIGSFAAPKPIQLDWFPITRDVIIYMFAVALLVAITWDGTIFWYEGLVLFIVYFLYFTIMFNNVRISNFIMRQVHKFRKPKDEKGKDVEKSAANSVINSERPSIAVVSLYGSYSEEPATKYINETTVEESSSDDDEKPSLFKMPEGTRFQKLFFFYTWPLKFLLMCLIPPPKKYPKLLPISFSLCIIFIGVNSYVVSWMMTLIGKLFSIPDAVLGMTFLAAGGCLPESISLTIMTRRGEGSFGVSNSMGANTMNILLSLGMPWFLKTITMGTNNSAVIHIESGSIEYTISALIPVALVLFATLYFNGFKLCKRVGFTLITVYTIAITLAILAELVFFHNDSACSDS